MALNPDPTQTSARTIIDMALRDGGVIGLGQSAPQQTINLAIIRLNWLIQQWNTKRWFAFRLADIAAVSAGQQAFTIGPGGNFNILSDFNADFNSDFGSGQPYGTRPRKIERAYSRLLAASPAQPVDFPLTPILSREDYANVRLKSQTNFPTHFFYDPQVPLGLVYFWPIPLPGQFEMHVLIRQPLLSIQGLDDVILLPPEYFMAIELTLARWLRSAAKLPVDPELQALCRNAVNSVKNNNTAIANLTMPENLTRAGIYNILADEWH